MPRLLSLTVTIHLFHLILRLRLSCRHRARCPLLLFVCRSFVQIVESTTQAFNIYLPIVPVHVHLTRVRDFFSSQFKPPLAVRLQVFFIVAALGEIEWEL